MMIIISFKGSTIHTAESIMHHHCFNVCYEFTSYIANFSPSAVHKHFLHFKHIVLHSLKGVIYTHMYIIS
jgi:hypothetical protein